MDEKFLSMKQKQSNGNDNSLLNNIQNKAVALGGILVD
jgi:hypothetical protein